jgi:hypothetical protein
VCDLIEECVGIEGASVHALRLPLGVSQSYLWNRVEGYQIGYPTKVSRQQIGKKEYIENLSIKVTLLIVNKTINSQKQYGTISGEE